MYRLVFFFVLLSCGILSRAQDSFHNPNRFKYIIERSSEYETDSICGKLSVSYDNETCMSSYCLQYNDGREIKGLVIDKQLDLNSQVFKLEKFFYGKYNACIAIYRKDSGESQKVGFIYYDNQEEDVAPEKTCIFLMLEDYDYDSILNK